jgi:hypothetical protein
MSDPSFLTYEFSKSLARPTLLSDIGKGLVGLNDQFQNQQMQEQYNLALNNVYQNPTNEAISNLYQIAEPLGRFQNARAAVNDLFARMPQDQVAAATAAQDPNMIAYNQAMEAWRQDQTNPDLILNLQNASNPVGLFDETQEMITGRVEEITQQNARRAASTAFDAYIESGSLEDRNAWLNAAKEAGVYNEAQEMIAQMSEEERLADVKEGLDIFGPLAHGAPDLALENINRDITAYRDAGDEDSAARLESIKSLIEGGDIQAAMGILGTALGAYEEGQAGMDTALAMAANQRQGESHIANMLNNAINTELTNEEMRSRLQEVWADSPVIDFGLGSVLIDMAQVFESEGWSADQQLTAVRALRNQYLGETEEWQGINESNSKVRQSALRAMLTAATPGVTDNAIGAADLALVNSFQRLIDPATVRESDITNMRATIGGFAQVEQWVEQFRTGAKFSPEQRQTIMEVAGQLSGVYSDIESRARDFIDTYAPRIGETTEDVIGDIVFDPYDEEKQLEEFKMVMVGVDPRNSEAINRVESLEELERDYPNAYRALTGSAVQAGTPNSGSGGTTTTTTPPEEQELFDLGYGG